MTRYIDADALEQEMYHKSFEVDDGRNVWHSGLWIRYKIFEEAIRDVPTVDAIPVEWIEAWWYRYRFVEIDIDDLLAGWEAQKNDYHRL